MTLDDLELLLVRIFVEFRRFGRQQQLNECK